QVLTFIQGSQVRVIRIVALAERRGPAPEAALLYEDLAPAPPKRIKHDETVQRDFETRGKGDGRPTKRLRRQTDRLKSGFIEREG
ncbi:MAG: RNA-binding S4 domain-containing protein, partial [Candidatus Puniceispirillum sp.]